MMRRILISLAVAFLATLLTYLAIFALAPTMYVEKALTILVAVFIGSAGITSVMLMRKRRN